MKNLRNIALVAAIVMTVLSLNTNALAGLLVSDFVGTDNNAPGCSVKDPVENNLDGGILVTLTGILVTFAGGTSGDDAKKDCAIIVHD